MFSSYRHLLKSCHVSQVSNRVFKLLKLRTICQVTSRLVVSAVIGSTCIILSVVQLIKIKLACWV